MPTYQYVCTECGDSLEAVQSFTDDALTTCPACGGRLRKVFSAVGVVFKGSGFYRNDSRTASGSKSAAGSNGVGASAGGEAEPPAPIPARPTPPASGSGKTDPAKAGKQSSDAKPSSNGSSPTAKPAAKPSGSGSAA